MAIPCVNVQSPSLTTATTPPHSHSSTVFLQGLIGVPLPTPPLAIRLSKNTYSSLHTITCTRHWVCFDFFSPSGLIKRRGRKRRNREKLFRFIGSAVSKRFGLSRERVQRQRGNLHNLWIFFRFVEFFV